MQLLHAGSIQIESSRIGLCGVKNDDEDDNGDDDDDDAIG